MKIQVAVYSGEPVLVSGLRAVLEQGGEFQVSELACPSDELASCVERLRADVLLVDVDDGLPLSVLADVVRSAPTCRVVLWARDVSVPFAYCAVEAGIKGILTKKLGPDAVTRCLKAVAGGEVWFERALAQRLFEAKTVRLTRREQELFVLVTQGLTNRQIAGVLSVSPGTVRFYLSRLFRKMLVSNRAELASYGVKMRLDNGTTAQQMGRLLKSGLPRLVVLDSEDGDLACR